jgi:MraZ protein
MLTRKTQYGWMALGGMICLFGLVLACKLRDGNRASAQPEPLPLPAISEKEKPATPPAKTSEPTPPPVLPPLVQTKEPEFVLPPPKSEKTKEPALKEKPSTPKATLEMPLPSDPPPMPSSPKAQTPPPSGPSILPASFAPNEPTLSEKKSPEPPPSPTSPSPLDKAKSELKPGTDVPSKPSLPMIEASPPPPLPAPKPAGSAGKTTTTDQLKQSTTFPSWNAPGTVVPASAAPPSEHESAKTQPGEPPLAPAPGPVQLYHVHGSETLQDIARRTLGSSERWTDLHKLNPMLKHDEPLSSGTTVRLPADACVQTDDAEPIKPLPALRAKPPAPKAKVLPLTGTYQCSLDEKGQLTLPRAIRDQLNSSDTVLLSPGPDKCLWLTNQPHLERLGERLEQSHANEADVRVFKRLYFAQTEKLSVNGDGRVIIPERLGQFAGLHQEVVLVGIDDHFEVWDAARWRSYTQQKSRFATAAEQE